MRALCARLASRTTWAPLALAAALLADSTVASAQADSPSNDDVRIPSAADPPAQPPAGVVEGDPQRAGATAAGGSEEAERKQAHEDAGLGHYAFDETTVTATPLGRTLSNSPSPSRS